MQKKTKATKTKTIKIGGITLPILNQTGNNVPLSAQKIELPTSDKRALAIALKNNVPTLLIGETGTGKTSAIKELAFLRKQNYTRISLTGYTTPDELIGSKSVKNGETYYENGILTKAMLEGHIVVLDELNAITPDCSFIIHGLLDDEKKLSLPNGDIITPHKDFRVFATINPDYEGTRSMNRAFLDRFGILLFIDLLSPKAEVALLVERTGISEKEATKLVAVAWLNRKAYAEQKTLTLISTRSLLQTAELIKEGLRSAEAYKTAVLHKARREEAKAFMDFYNVIYKTNIGIDDAIPEILTPAEVAKRTEYLQRIEKENSENLRKVMGLERNEITLKAQLDRLNTIVTELEKKSGYKAVVKEKFEKGDRVEISPTSRYFNRPKGSGQLPVGTFGIIVNEPSSNADAILVEWEETTDGNTVKIRNYYQDIDLASAIELKKC